MASLWIERTRWAETYRGARHDILVALTQPPSAYSQRCGLSLGRQADLELRSRPEDERRFEQIGHAVDRLFDRCEETAVYWPLFSAGCVLGMPEAYSASYSSWWVTQALDIVTNGCVGDFFGSLFRCTKCCRRPSGGSEPTPDGTSVECDAKGVG
jgi:hypothetical protein